MPRTQSGVSFFYKSLANFIDKWYKKLSICFHFLWHFLSITLPYLYLNRLVPYINITKGLSANLQRLKWLWAPQHRRSSRLLPWASPSPTGAQNLSPLSVSPPETDLPPTSENCPRRPLLHWRWPLYLERAQTWLLWQWGCSRRHRNVGLRQTASVQSRDLGGTPKREVDEETDHSHVSKETHTRSSAPTFW